MWWRLNSSAITTINIHLKETSVTYQRRPRGWCWRQPREARCAGSARTFLCTLGYFLTRCLARRLQSSCFPPQGLGRRGCFRVAAHLGTLPLISCCLTPNCIWRNRGCSNDSAKIALNTNNQPFYWLHTLYCINLVNCGYREISIAVQWLTRDSSCTFFPRFFHLFLCTERVGGSAGLAMVWHFNPLCLDKSVWLLRWCSLCYF